MRPLRNDSQETARLEIYNSYGQMVTSTTLAPNETQELPLYARDIKTYAGEREIYLYDGEGELNLSDTATRYDFTDLRVTDVRDFLAGNFTGEPREAREIQKFITLSDANLAKGRDYLSPPGYHRLHQELAGFKEARLCKRERL